MGSTQGSATGIEGREVKACSGSDREPSLQQGIRDFAIEAFRRRGTTQNADMLQYSSVIKMLAALRHRNPECYGTVNTYLYNLRMIVTTLGKTPDELVKELASSSEDEIEQVLLRLDQVWIQDLNSTSTRRGKWAVLRTFLYSNGIRRVQLLKLNIQTYRKYVDYVLTKDDCRKILDTARSIGDKLLVSLLIESLQRIGTISLLTWGDMLSHLDKQEDIFLVWIDAKRTKRNISHWMPVGRLSTYYLKQRREELAAMGTAVNENMPLISGSYDPRRALRADPLIERMHRFMKKAGILGKRQQSGYSVRYEKHTHCFRKFGVVEMQRQNINEEVIRFLMGQHRDTYSNWENRYDDLLDIYRKAMPSLDTRDAVTDILDFARSRGYSLDPRTLTKLECGECGNFRPGESHSQPSCEAAGA